MTTLVLIGFIVRALAFVGSVGGAEEVVQDTWMTVIAGIDRFEERSSLRTWIGGILVNRAKTRGVADRRAASFSSPPPDDAEAAESERFGPRGYWSAPPTAWDTAPEALTLRKEACEQIDHELSNLPPQRDLPP